MTVLMFLQTILERGPLDVACSRVFLPSKPRMPLLLGHRGFLGFVVPATRRSSCAPAGRTECIHTRRRRRPGPSLASWQLAERRAIHAAPPLQLAYPRRARTWRTSALSALVSAANVIALPSLCQLLLASDLVRSVRPV